MFSELWPEMSQTPPAGIYLLRVKNRNTKTTYKICLKSTMKTPERRHLYPLKTSDNFWFILIHSLFHVNLQQSLILLMIKIWMPLKQIPVCL